MRPPPVGARIVLDPAVKADAPAGIIGWIDEPSTELSNAIVSHDDTALILATDGPNMVHAAYSSGRPSIATDRLGALTACGAFFTCSPVMSALLRD